MCIARIKQLKQTLAEKKLYSLMQRYGVHKSQIEPIKSEFRKPSKGLDYYYYSGPLDEKTRPFCALMLKLDKVFSEDDIAIMTIELGYDVQQYRGSYNCRHKWVKFRGKDISTPAPTINQIRKLIDKGIHS